MLATGLCVESHEATQPIGSNVGQSEQCELRQTQASVVVVRKWAWSLKSRSLLAAPVIWRSRVHLLSAAQLTLLVCLAYVWIVAWAGRAGPF
jgi:hypothetical protein